MKFVRGLTYVLSLVCAACLALLFVVGGISTLNLYDSQAMASVDPDVRAVGRLLIIKFIVLGGVFSLSSLGLLFRVRWSRQVTALSLIGTGVYLAWASAQATKLALPSGAPEVNWTAVAVVSSVISLVGLGLLLTTLLNRGPSRIVAGQN